MGKKEARTTQPGLFMFPYLRFTISSLACHNGRLFHYETRLAAATPPLVVAPKDRRKLPRLDSL